MSTPPTRTGIWSISLFVVTDASGKKRVLALSGSHGPLYVFGESDRFLLAAGEFISMYALKPAAQHWKMVEPWAKSCLEQGAVVGDRTLLQRAVDGGLVDGNPAVEKVWVWRETDVELLSKDLRRAHSISPQRQPGEVDMHREHLFDGDILAGVNGDYVGFTHLKTPSTHAHAHFQFEIRLRVNGEAVDWDPDVHNEAPRP